MKRLFLLLLLVPALCELHAQAFPEGTTSAYYAPNPNSNVKYRGSLDASIRIGNSGVGRYGITTIHGLGIGDYAMVGLGTGLYYYTQRYYKETTQWTLFLHGQSNLINPKKHKFVPYAGASVGYSAINSFFAEPTFGVKMMLKGSKALKLSIGYVYEKYNGSLSKMWEPVPGSGPIIVDPETGESFPADGGYVLLDDVREHLSGLVISFGYQF